jgi:hypothetical protein
MGSIAVATSFGRFIRGSPIHKNIGLNVSSAAR